MLSLSAFCGFLPCPALLKMAGLFCAFFHFEQKQLFFVKINKEIDSLLRTDGLASIPFLPV